MSEPPRRSRLRPLFVDVIAGVFRRVSTTSSLLLQSHRLFTPAKSSADIASVEVRPTVPILGRFGWALADQLLSSATNFALALLVARTVVARDLGAFSVAFTTFTLSLGAVRAIAGELLVVRYSAVPAEEWRYGVKRAAGTTLMAGIVVAVIALVAATTMGGAVRGVLSIVAIGLPFLLLQDVWRFAFFARGRGRAAFLNDLVWAVLTFAAFAVLRHFDVSSVLWFTSCWAAAGFIAAIVGVVQLKLAPSSPRAALKWLRRHSDIAPRFFAEFAVGTGVASLTLFAFVAIAGLGEVGRLRAGEIALGPLNVLFAGVGLVATAESVRLLHQSPNRFVHGCRSLSFLLTAGVVAWGTILLSVPRGVGEFVLRDNWDPARSLLTPLVIGLTGWASSYGALIGLRSLAAARRSLRAKCLDALLNLVAGVSGAYLAGATGVAWGSAVTGCLRSVVAWGQFSRALREHKHGQQGRNTMPTAGEADG